MKYALLIIATVLLNLTSFAQVTETEDSKAGEPVKTANPKIKDDDTKLEAKSKVPKVKVPYHFMANLHGGIGLMNYFGDVIDRDKTTVHRIGNRAGFNFGIGGNLTNWLDLNIDVLMGKLNGNENNYGKHRNFESKVFTAGASLTYNFKNLIHNPQSITPFISVGVSYSDYDIYTDVQDKDGNVYYYWDDGLIRNVDQSSPATDNIKILDRDFEYETRLSKFPITAVAIPVGVGLDLNASRKFAVRLGAFYYFTTSDNIDNAVGGSKGFLSNDGFLYTTLSVFYRFDPFKKRAEKLEAPTGFAADLGNIEIEDTDMDGITDFNDQCEGTPKGLAVDDKGCPADDDNDGIPNYRDKQLDTPTGKIVTPAGVAINYKEIYENFGPDTISIARDKVTKGWLYSQPDKDTKYTVHVGTYTNYDIPTQLKIRLSKMQGLVERKVNDTVSVFTLGTFNDFESAEKKQNELIKSGIDEAFGVNKRALVTVAENLETIEPAVSQNQPKGTALDFVDKQVLTYGVELREYRLRIQLDKLSRLIAKHGVEMKTTTGGMKIYTIGAFSTMAEADALRKTVAELGVRNPTVTAKLNNRSIELDRAQELEKAAGE